VDHGRSLARNALSGWATQAVSILVTLTVTPFVVHALDTELYGVWSWLNGLLMYTDLLYFGLGSAIIKNVAAYRAKQDLPAVARVVSVVTSIYGVIGLVCLAVLVWIGSALPDLLAEPLSREAARQASITCTLLGVQMLLVFIGSGFAGLIAGHDRFYLFNAVQITAVLARCAGTFALVRRDDNPLMYLAIVTAASAAIQTGALVAIGTRLIRGASIRPARPKLSELAHLYSFGLQSFFVLFAVRLISYTDTTVIGVRLGAESVAAYNLPLMLIEQARNAIAAISTVLLPRVAGLAAEGKTAAIREFYIGTTRVTGFIAGWLAALGITLGPAFLNRWIGPDFGTPVQWVLVYLAIAMFCQNLTIHGPLAFYQSLHLLRWPGLVLLGEALVNLGLSIWLAPILGINGVALATIIPTLVLSTLILPPYLCRHLGLPFRRFLLEGAGPGVLSLVTTLGIGWSSGFVIDSQTYAGIAARAVATAPAAFAIFRATFPKDQQLRLWQLVGLLRAK
jgi:O-antigen/teichoic acid export membrane protein